jgi:hypothetical protein
LLRQEVEKTEKKKSSRMKATKDFKLLSFGEEAEGDEETLAEVPWGCLMIFFVFFHNFLLPLKGTLS